MTEQATPALKVIAQGPKAAAARVEELRIAKLRDLYFDPMSEAQFGSRSLETTINAMLDACNRWRQAEWTLYCSSGKSPEMLQHMNGTNDVMRDRAGANIEHAILGHCMSKNGTPEQFAAGQELFEKAYKPRIEQIFSRVEPERMEGRAL